MHESSSRHRPCSGAGSDLRAFVCTFASLRRHSAFAQIALKLAPKKFPCAVSPTGLKQTTGGSPKLSAQGSDSMAA